MDKGKRVLVVGSPSRNWEQWEQTERQQAVVDGLLEAGHHVIWFRPIAPLPQKNPKIEKYNTTISKLSRKKLLHSFITFVLSPIWLFHAVISKKAKCILVFDPVQATLAGFASFLLRVPIVMFALPEALNAQLAPSRWALGRLFQKMFYVLGFNFCKKVIVSSDFAKKSAKKIPYISQKKIFVHRRPLSKVLEESETEKRDKLIEHYELPEKSITVCLYGVFGKGSNIEKCLRALSASNSERLTYIICEDGERQTNVRSLCVGLGLNEEVVFVDDRKQFKSVLQSADIYLLPTASQDVSLAFIEALSGGAIILSAPSEAIAEVIKDERLLLDTSHVDTMAKSLRALGQQKGHLEELRKISAQSRSYFSNNWSDFFDGILDFSKT